MTKHSVKNVSAINKLHGECSKISKSSSNSLIIMKRFELYYRQLYVNYYGVLCRTKRSDLLFEAVSRLKERFLERRNIKYVYNVEQLCINGYPMQ